MDANGRQEFIPQQDSNHPKKSMLNIFSSIVELDALYSFHEQNKTRELIRIVARALLGPSRSKWTKNMAMIHTVNDASFMKVVQKTWKQMFGDTVFKEQLEWMKKAMFPINTNLDKAIKRLQEINGKLEFFESDTSKLSDKELKQGTQMHKS